ncbi:laminin B domain-containing protein [Methylobacillus sp.]|uniref:laminin B domain-containing protein n=1 Tax=Methylobacillus sp. TaxID=56818 RepID=UPI002FE425D5
MLKTNILISILSLTLLNSAAFAASSDFSTGDDSWRAAGDADGPLSWQANGGNPGGHVSIDDLTIGGVTFFIAPAKFLGNQSAALGSNLTFDLQQIYSGSPSQFDDADVILQGAGLTLVFDIGDHPANGAWTSYSVPLIADGWRLNSLSGAAASDEQFIAVLSDLSALKIRAEYRTGPDIGLLDNVTLVPEPSTYGMLLIGLGAFAALGRRRRNQA